MWHDQSGQRCILFSVYLPGITKADDQFPFSSFICFSICLALSPYYMHDRYAKIFIVAAIMVVCSVAALWYISSLGGYDPKKEWWWNVILIPYPVGWLISIITLIVRWVKREDRLETGD